MMFRRILIPIDINRLGLITKIIPIVKDIASINNNVRIHLLISPLFPIIHGISGFITGYSSSNILIKSIKEIENHRLTMLSDMFCFLQERFIVHYVNSEPADIIVELADQIKADLILVGSSYPYQLMPSWIDLIETVAINNSKIPVLFIKNK
ncbi:hypothetical protein FPT84_24750 [Salmonella enterica]|uniref:Universal stress protein n=1 Tax=Salmonella enterica I TaxID=59201 RepID=A0A5U3G4Q3_SALET|nr:hypothetical protein [Salmonella enterica]EBP4060789.1 hypothetical protein [Salmonella enterica subsp. enterica]EDI0749060.1 hypothetical protein [Salmonella enterica subsp. enterica serovar Kisarawe]AXD45930.1 hypothetical protein CHD70_27765 [Salmonella enterica]EAU6767159.1 hypothetical protein [Salmonella enterica]EAU9939805.1 hypothetical protein [Salmonella enterica]